MYNYFNFDGTQINDLAIVTKIEKPYIPERAIDTINISGRDGEIFDGAKYDPVKIPISLAIIGDDEYDYFTRVNALHDILRTKEEVPIKFCDNVTIYGMLNSSFTPEKKNKCTAYADIELICHTPYSYSDNILAFNKEDETKTVTVNYNGEQPTLPFMSVGFSKDSHFAQIENIETGDTILVGDYPKLYLSSKKKEQTRILFDKCQTLDGLITTGANIDSDRSTNGSFAISSSGESYCLSSMGDGDTTWKGACGRVALSKNLDEFKLRINMHHNSKGKNGDPNYFDPDIDTTKEKVESGGKTYYYQVTASGVHYRTGPGTNYKSKGIMPKGTKLTDVTIQNNWAKIKYKTKTYYMSAKYLTKKCKDNSKSTYKTFQIMNMIVLPQEKRTNTGVKLWASPTSTKVVATIPYGTIVRVLCRKFPYTYTENGQKKTKYYYKLWKPYVDKNGKKHKGAINIDYLRAPGELEYSTDYETDPGYADDKTGVVEVYGFDVNGSQLFKMSLIDDNEYFEYTRPEIRIGSKVVLKDTSKTPKAKARKVADKDNVTNSYYLSGKYGSWNDFDGTFWLTRKKIGKNYAWSCTVQKKKDGKVVKSQSTNNKKSNEFPKAELSYLAIYIGSSASSNAKLSAMSVSQIEVFELNPEADTDEDITYFQAGDVLDLDFENGNCYLNNELINNLVDIGSTYFPIEPGETDISINSDDTEASLGVLVQEKWLGVVDEDRATPAENLTLTSE